MIQAPSQQGLSPQIAINRPYIPYTDADAELPTVRRFERQAARVPDRIAVRDRDESLTYADLDAAANRLAHVILDWVGVGNGVIGLCIAHGVWSVAGIWGVLKAGKAYFVLDPKLPPARLREMILDAQVRLLAVDEAHLSLIQSFDLPDVSIVPLSERATQPNTSPDIALSLDDPMSLFYTSGSTGKPKGVLRSHRSRVNSARYRTNLFHISETDRQFYMGSFGFSASVNNVLVPMLNGAALHLFDFEREGLQNIPKRIDAEQITIYTSTPTMFRAWTALLPPETYFDSLRLIQLGGETIRSDDFETFRRITRYGSHFSTNLASSEGGMLTVYVTDHDTKVEMGVFPIGYPAENRQLMLVDENGQPTPAGEVGEIVILDQFAASGYLNRSEQSAAKFKIDADGRSMVFTGDLAKMRPDGCYIHMGRKDTQIKINGQRIELGEIESVLLTHPALKQAVVVPIENANGSKTLVGYCVPYEVNRPPTSDEIRTFLRDRLPEIMIPTHLAFIGELPLNANGKVDLQKLIKPSGYTPPPPEWGAKIMLPTDEIERTLVKIWESALKVSPIGIDENFFTLGGHSLLAAFVFAQIEERFGRVIPLTAMLEQPTIVQLAELIREHVDIPWSPLVPIRPIDPSVPDHRPPLFCFHGGDGFVMIYQLLSKYLSPDQPVYGLQAAGIDNRREPVTDIQVMAANYIAAMRTVQPSGTYFLCGYSGGGHLALEVAHQLIEAGDRVAFVGMIDTVFHGRPRHSLNRNRITRLLSTGYEYIRNFIEVPHWYKPRYIERVAEVVMSRIRHGRTPMEPPPRLPQRIETLRQANMHATHSYRRGRYAGRVDYFWALHRPFDVQVFRRLDQLTAQYKLHEVPGTHSSVIREPHIQTLGATMQRVMDEIRVSENPL